MANSVLFDVNSPTTAATAASTGNYYASNTRKDDLQFYSSGYQPSYYYANSPSSPPTATGDMAREMGRGFWSAFGTQGYPNEPPLLEELGVNFSHIKDKSLVVLIPFRTIPASIMDDSDLAGPLLYLFLYGIGLMLSGKTHFSYIYGVGVLGVGSIYLLLNAMSQHVGVDWSRTASVLGYCMLPMVMLSGISIVLQLGGTVGFSLAVVSIVWCTLTSAAMFTSVLHMHDQRLLITYPVGLFYACFALMTVF